MIVFLFIASLLIVGFFLFFAIRKKSSVLLPDEALQKEILQQHVQFYQALDNDKKLEFEARIQKFLQRTTITGVKTDVADMDKVFIAAAAIIPIFAFKDWEYRNINEVLLYPGSFSKDFQIEGVGRDTLGMVGNGPMQHVMILSKRDLRSGFLDDSNTSNTAIHEFVHLIDKSDGNTDGLPEVLLHHSYVLPWLHRMHEEVQKIHSGKSDINPYGSTNEAEFLAVAAEYFFKQPGMMSENHPELFKMLTQIFVVGPLEKNRSVS